MATESGFSIWVKVTLKLKLKALGWSANLTFFGVWALIHIFILFTLDSAFVLFRFVSFRFLFVVVLFCFLFCCCSCSCFLLFCFVLVFFFGFVLFCFWFCFVLFCFVFFFVLFFVLFCFFLLQSAQGCNKSSLLLLLLLLCVRYASLTNECVLPSQHVNTYVTKVLLLPLVPKGGS